MEQQKQQSEAAISAAKIADAATTAAKIVTDVADEASRVTFQTTLTATEASRHQEREYIKILAEALRQVFGENQESQRFVDVSRIPLICKNINDMHENIKEINDKLDTKFINNDQFWPVKTLVYGATGIILVAVFSALIYLVIK